MSGTAVTPFEEVLAAGGERVRALMVEVERALAGATAAHGRVLAGAAGDTLAAGGKRLRPLLVFICGERGGPTPGSGTELVRAAAAVELIHMATLVHDDVIDSAPVRRGRPTVYATAGRGTATATGDFLFSRAFSLLSENGDGVQVQVLSDACLDLARGELVQRADRYASGIAVERYLERCRLKTASLFAAACRLGALAAGEGSDGTVEALGRFGDLVGLAFQLLDDVLDVAGEAERTGKERGTDLLEGTSTLPLILAGRSDPELASVELAEVKTRAQAERLCDRIVATGAVDDARDHAAALVASAKSELEENVEPELEALLTLVADRIVDRYS
jgi:geranylgeranyl pyrophosphate synthase